MFSSSSAVVPAGTITIEANGSALSGGGSFLGACTGGTLQGKNDGFFAAMQGTLNADGSFEIKGGRSTSDIIYADIQGQAPSAAGGAWTGTATIALNEPQCVLQATVPFTASSKPLVQGTYSGTLQNVDDDENSMDMVVVLQQTTALSTGTTPVYLNATISGTMTETPHAPDYPCTVTGTQSVGYSGVYGDELQVEFGPYDTYSGVISNGTEGFDEAIISADGSTINVIGGYSCSNDGAYQGTLTRQ